MPALLQTLSLFDWVVFVFFLIVTYVSIFYGHFIKNKNLGGKSQWLDYLLMGRKLTLPFFVMSLVATWYGGIFGVTQISFEKGIYNFITQGVFWYLAYLIFALFLAERIRNSNSVTLPDLVKKHYGNAAGKWAAVLNFFNILPIAYAMSIGIFLENIFGVPYHLGMFLGIATVISYTLAGGFRAVVFSDVIQFSVMCLSVFLVLIFCFSTYGGFSYLSTHLPPSHFSITGGESIGNVMVWGFIAFTTLVDPSFYQRCLAADSPRTAKMGILYSILIWMAFDVCTTAGGLYARAAFSHVDSQNAYLHMSLNVLPSGLRGFFLAGVFATIVSTLEGFLFIAANTLSYDLLPQKWGTNRWVNRIGLVVAGGICYLISLCFKGDIKTSWKTLGTFATVSLFWPLILGLLFRKRNLSHNGFFASSCAGIIAVVIWRFFDLEAFTSFDAIYPGLVSSMLVVLGFFGWRRK